MEWLIVSNLALWVIVLSINGVLVKYIRGLKSHMNTKHRLDFEPELMDVWKREINKWPEKSAEHKAYKRNIEDYSDGGRYSS